VISWRGRWENVRTQLRMRSQGVGFWLGLVLAAAAALLWHRKLIGDIWGSFLVGVSAAILAAAVVAYLSPLDGFFHSESNMSGSKDKTSMANTGSTV
jgi:hypothetical protein